MKKISIILMFLFVITNAYGYSEQLSNGMKLIINSDMNTPHTVVKAFFRSGSRYEQKYTVGISQFTHTMIERNMSEKVKRDLVKHGITTTFNTQKDFSSILVRCKKQTLDSALNGLFNIISNTEFSSDSFKNTQNDMITYEAAMQNKPWQYCNTLFHLISYGKHTYKFPVYGTEPSLKYISPSMIQNWYDRFYIPNNMVLTVSGNVSVENTSALIRKIFEQLKYKPLPIQILRMMICGKFIEQPMIIDRQKWVVKNNDRTQIIYGYPAPSVFHEHALALEVVQRYLNAELERICKKDRTLQLFSGYPQRADTSFIAVSVNCPVGKHEVAVNMIQKRIEQILKNGMDKRLFKKIKQNMIQESEKSTTLQRTLIQGWLEIIDRGQAYMDIRAQQLKKLDIRTVNRIFNTYMDQKYYMFAAYGKK